ncbi:hypothetical protein E0L29_00175 [Chlorobium sp. N1]|nr:hypothetical protein E0L29_00175 [Chlorobium sp. N1]
MAGFVRRIKHSVPLLALASCIAVSAAGDLRAAARKATVWKKYRGTSIHTLQGNRAYCYATGFMTIDADGAPEAYHPKNTGLDDLSNAGYPRTSWWDTVLVPDPADNSRPYILKSGPHAGYYVSMTALKDLRWADTDSRRYVDASRVPYIVFPETFAALEGVGQIGDYGVAVNLASGCSSGFVVADIGPRRHPLGEISIALACRLGGKDVSARTGPSRPMGRILYIVFPGSAGRYPWPREVHSIEAITRKMLDEAGGVAAAAAAVGCVLPEAVAGGLGPCRSGTGH